MDSDDYLKCNCIEKSLLKLQKHQAQIVCFGINRCRENGVKIGSDFGIFEQVSKNQVLDGSEVLWQTGKDYFYSACGFIVDFRFFQSLKLKFIEGIIYEDHCFGTFLFLKSQRIVVLDQYLYSYVGSTNSITRPKCITQERKILNLKSWIRTIEELEKFPLHTKFSRKQIRRFYLPAAYIVHLSLISNHILEKI